MKKIALYLAIFGLISCKDDVIVEKTDYSAVLENISTNVIVETYKDFDNAANELLLATQTLSTTRNSTNFELCKQKWRNARIYWEQSEGFLFGPVDIEGIDPKVDSWPLDTLNLNAVLRSSDAITLNYVENLQNTQRGFHTIEYLLFGISANKLVGDLTQREIDYLLACSQSLSNATNQLLNGWKSTGDNYVSNFINAGKSGSVYPSQKSALEELVQGIVTIANEVGNGKINDPFVSEDITLEESRFSNNSKADFADNIRSVKNIYLGDYGTTIGKGITDIIASKNIDLDNRVKDKITLAIAAIEAIPGTFTLAITNHKPEVANAQQKVRELQTILESEVLPVISNL
jgi:predicted lipoprotein